MKPSEAAVALRIILSLPQGAAVIWPVTLNGHTTLVVRLSQHFWEKSAQIPEWFEGYPVEVELNEALAPHYA